MKNNAKKTQLPSINQNHKKQRNLVTQLNKWFKKEYFHNIEDKTGSKNLLNYFKSYFSNKYNNGCSKILLIENAEIINEGDE